MAFIDEIRITAKAGKGGDGVVRWLHEKGKEFGGPSGGNGGNGGNIIFRGVRDLQILGKYRGATTFVAKNGEHGGGKQMAGKNGDDTVIDVPVGAVVTRKSTQENFEILREDDHVLALKGGRGGVGNTHFKSSTNQYPEEAIPGRPGEEDIFYIELKIIADVGLIGLPNTGKSSLLNSLTASRAKIGSYAFTTLEPNLGVFYGYVIADIPGLIEGAALGKGLGHDFLRHISRTKLLIHCVPSDSEQPLEDYKTVRKEITKFSEELSRKPEIVFLTKADMVSKEVLTDLKKTLSSENKEVVPVSILDDALLKSAGDALVRFLQKN